MNYTSVRYKNMCTKHWCTQFPKTNTIEHKRQVGPEVKVAENNIILSNS